MSIDLSPMNPDVDPLSIRMSAFKNYLDMGVHYGWYPLGLVYVHKKVVYYDIDEDGNETPAGTERHFGTKRLSDKRTERYLASDGHLFDQADVLDFLKALSRHKEKDKDLVRFMEFLSQSGGVHIL